MKNKIKMENEGIPDTANVFRGRELLLREFPNLVQILEIGNTLNNDERLIYITDQAQKLAEKYKYPKSFTKQLVKSFMQDKLLSIYKENLDYDTTPDLTEIVIYINKSTSKREWLDLWNNKLSLLKAGLKETHKPIKINHNAFIFTMLHKYKGNNKLSKEIKEFIKNHPEYENNENYSDRVIRQLVYNTEKKLKIKNYNK